MAIYQNKRRPDVRAFANPADSAELGSLSNLLTWLYTVAHLNACCLAIRPGPHALWLSEASCLPLLTLQSATSEPRQAALACARDMSASTRSATSTQPSRLGVLSRSSGTVSSSRSSRSGLMTTGALRTLARLNSCNGQGCFANVYVVPQVLLAVVHDSASVSKIWQVAGESLM